MNYPSLAIIIPMYNGERFIEQTLWSCLIQDYKGIVEIILVDDQSTDSGVELAEKYVAGFPSIKLIKNTSNMGLMKTNNVGLNHAISDYILFLGQDDILPPDHTRKMIRYLEDKNLGYAWCNSVIIDEKGSYIKQALTPWKQKIKQTFFALFLCRSNFISSAGMVIRTDSLKSVGGWPTLYKNFGEWLLWIKLASSFKGHFCSSSSVFYRRHNENLSSFVDDGFYSSDLREYFSKCRIEAINSFFKSSFLNKIIRIMFLKEA